MRILKRRAAGLMKLLATGCAPLVALWCAAGLPKQFNGFWVGAEVPNKAECRRLKDVDSDGTMSVAGGTITQY